MVQLCSSSNFVSTQCEGEFKDCIWSDELDHVPLMVRRKILLESQPNYVRNSLESIESPNKSLIPVGPDVIKKEDECCKHQGENPNALWSNELEHVPLIERRKTLLAVKELFEENNLNSVSLGDRNTSVSLKFSEVFVQKEGNFSDKRVFCEGFSKSLLQQCACEAKEDTDSGHEVSPVSQNQFVDLPEITTNALCKTSLIGLSDSITAGSVHRTRTEVTNLITNVNINESGRLCSSERMTNKHKSSGGQENLNINVNTVQGSALSISAKVKDDPVDNDNLPTVDKNAVSSFCFNLLAVKRELEIDELVDKLDHTLLRDRLKLLISGQGSDSNFYSDVDLKISPSILEDKPIPESIKPLNIIRPRKRKKTATDSVEIAMEEDAPGLLKVLLEKGVLVGEIKLYGEPENDDPLDESLCEDSFSELEAVISKLFIEHQPVLKFAPIRCAKASKASYCLACLFSLVEQMQYLKFRKWPVEWGWCRELQAFIFVFERHNRIVLERPEYGYATYFFELVNSIPINWQVKRLVTTMKLTNCSRINLIENKALVVGEDLTEGEARVLKEYGWIPNSGLGTMLNYCDRVFHDRKYEKSTSEWRSKIGKLLMDGYNGGSMLSTNITKKIVEYGDPQTPEIKLELEIDV